MTYSLRRTTAGILLISLCLTNSLPAEQILRVMRGFVLIELTENSGPAAGDRVEVYRSLEGGGRITVGLVEIVQFRDGRCAARIVHERPGMEIQPGDRVRSDDDSFLEGLFGVPREESGLTGGEESVLKGDGRPKEKRTGFGLILGAGLLSSAAGFYYNHQAGQMMDEYKLTPDTDRGSRYYAKAGEYRQWSTLAFIGGGFLILAALAGRFRGQAESQKPGTWVLEMPAANDRSVAFGIRFSGPLRPGRLPAGRRLRVY